MLMFVPAFRFSYQSVSSVPVEVLRELTLVSFRELSFSRTFSAHVVDGFSRLSLYTPFSDYGQREKHKFAPQDE
jgi:hypothetical protein